MARIKIPFKGGDQKVVNLFRNWYGANNNSRNFIAGPGLSIIGLLNIAINNLPLNCPACPPCPPMPPGPTIPTAETQGFSVTTYGTIDI